VTLIAGSRNAVLVSGAGDETSTNAPVDYVNDISAITTSGISTLDATGLGSVTLTADQPSEFRTINTGERRGRSGILVSGSGDDTLTASAGTNDIDGETIRMPPMLKRLPGNTGYAWTSCWHSYERDGHRICEIPMSEEHRVTN
jgi:hypothetical protein